MSAIASTASSVASTAVAATAVAATASSVAATAAAATSSMTRHEVEAALNQAEMEYTRALKHLERYESVRRRYDSRMEKYLLKSRKMEQKNPEDPRINEVRDQAHYLTQRCQEIEECITYSTETRDRVYSRMEQLRSQTAATATASTASASAASSVPSGDIQLMVRLLSGDIMTVNVDALLPVARFADSFAEQNHYAPSATLRMAFLFLDDSDESKDELDIFWAPEQRHEGKTVGDLLLGRPDAILNLIIRPLEDEDKVPKMALIRRILHTDGLNNHFSDDELFGMYSTWLLTWIPPAKTNRYIKMKSFIDAHHDTFLLLTPEEKEAQELRLNVERFKEFRENEAKYAALRYMNLNPLDVNVAAYVRGWARTYPNQSLPVQRLDFLLRRLTVSELLEAGMTREMVPPAHRYYHFIVNWDQYVALADATATATQ